MRARLDATFEQEEVLLKLCDCIKEKQDCSVLITGLCESSQNHIFCDPLLKYPLMKLQISIMACCFIISSSSLVVVLLTTGSHALSSCVT